MNTLLSPILIPLSLAILVGTSVEINTLSLMSSLFWMIVVPSLLGIALNYLPYVKHKDVKSTFAPFSKVGLLFVIAINSSVAAPVITLEWKLMQITFAVFCLASIGYVLGALTGKILKLENEVIISLLFNSGMRNISVGATIAILYFPPQVSVPIVLGTLFQQTLAAVYGRILSNYLENKENKENKENINHEMKMIN